MQRNATWGHVALRRPRGATWPSARSEFLGKGCNATPRGTTWRCVAHVGPRGPRRGRNSSEKDATQRHVGPRGAASPTWGHVALGAVGIPRKRMQRNATWGHVALRRPRGATWPSARSEFLGKG